MQKQGKPRFLKHHSNSVRGVAFSPRDRYLFCSGGYDGKVNIYSTLRMELLTSYSVTTPIYKNINAVRFTCDGSKILACTKSRRLLVVDVQRAEHLLTYYNCAASIKDRTGLATDPSSPNIAVSVTENGKGLTLLDLRMPLPINCIYELHSSTIRDIVFLDSSWPWATSNSMFGNLVSASSNSCKVCTINGQILHTFDSGCHVNTICVTPEPFRGFSSNGFYSFFMSGGDKIKSYVPDLGTQESLCENRDGEPIWKVRYTSNGSFLYSACEGGVVRKYRRYPNKHEYLGEVYTHKSGIQDLDISPYDDYLITASKDQSVGVLRLGAPSHGWTDYCELT